MRISNVAIGRQLGLSERGQALARGLAEINAPGYHLSGAISDDLGSWYDPTTWLKDTEIPGLPSELQKLITSVGQWTSWIEDNALPDALVAWIYNAVTTTEAALEETDDNLRSAMESLQERGISGGAEIQEIEKKKEESRQNFVDHNTFKFWCFIVPQLRDALKGNVKPSYLSVLSANDEIIAGFVAEHATDTIAARRDEGVMLDGLGLVPVVGAGAAAVFLAGAVVAYAIITNGAQVLRTWSDNARRKYGLEQVAAGVITGDQYVAAEKAAAEQDKANAPPPGSDPFSMLSKVAMWGGIALVVFLVGPPIISVLTAKMVAKVGA